MAVAPADGTKIIPGSFWSGNCLRQKAPHRIAKFTKILGAAGGRQPLRPMLPAGSRTGPARGISISAKRPKAMQTSVRDANPTLLPVLSVGYATGLQKFFDRRRLGIVDDLGGPGGFVKLKRTIL